MRAPAGALDVGDRCTRERLSAKAEARNRCEIRQLGDLARRVPDEGHGQVVGRDARAIVADPDRDLARAAHVDADPPRAGVEGVLDQLLHDRRRPLDDLARGDCVGTCARRWIDVTGPLSAARQLLQSLSGLNEPAQPLEPLRSGPEPSP